ncbi:MAG: hypothetical protein ACT4RN_15930 [Pseudonocardia sp.]
MDLGRLFGDLDLDDVAKAASFVMDNRDDVAKVLALFGDLPDGVTGFLKELPEFLERLGGGLAQAGEQAAKAANALVGDDGGGGARRALAGGADVMTSTRDQLGRAAGMLSGVATQLGEIDVPDVNPTYTRIAGMNVISGLEFGTNKLLGGPAQSLTEGAQTVTAVAGNLDLLSASLRELSDILGTVGEALDGLGERLSSSGAGVRGLLGPPS